jgi:pimeloyl-ACP methyl ester carboxylesterase
MQAIIYSHGFGVQKDDRGLFTDIAEALPSFEHVQFDYNQINIEENTLTAATLNQQAGLLSEQIRLARTKYETVDLICHSQGCLAAALANPRGVRSIIFLAPPDNTDIDQFADLFRNRPNSTINFKAISKVTRRDGSTTIIPAQYWSSLGSIDAMECYQALAQMSKLTIITAANDEILGETHFNIVPSKAITLPANHDFTKNARTPVIRAVQAILQ